MSKTVKAPSGKRTGIIIGVIAVVVIAAGLVAILAGGKKNDPSKASSTGAAEVHAVTITGTALDTMPDTSAGNVTDPGIGKKPPELDGQSFDGSKISIVPGGGWKLVVFVAHWCPHCRAEVPRIVSWMKAGSKPSNLQIYAVSTAVNRSPTNYPPSAWFQRENFAVPVLTDDAKSSAASAWGLPGYPYLVMLKPDGTVAARRSGEFADVTALDTWVKQSMGLA